MCSSANNPSQAAAANTAAQASENVANVNKAIAVLQLFAYTAIAYEQIAIAKKIDKRAQELHDSWKNSYLPCELKLLNELCSAGVEGANLELVESRAYADVGRRFAANRTKALYCLPYTAAGSRCEINTRFAIEQSKAEAGLSQIARNQELARVDLKNSQRQVNLASVLGFGRGGTSVAGSMAQVAGAQYAQIASQAAGAFNGTIAALGRIDEQNRISNTAGVVNQQPTIVVGDSNPNAFSLTGNSTRELRAWDNNISNTNNLQVQGTNVQPWSPTAGE
jgi:hypothetical protein